MECFLGKNYLKDVYNLLKQK